MASFAALLLSTHGAVAACTANNAGVNILALSGDTCFAVGPYSTTTNLSAARASGTNALITWPGEGNVSFSTSAIFFPTVEAENGGSVTLNMTAPYTGTVTLTGAGGTGLFATGAGSQITASGVTVSATGSTDAATSVAINADSGATVNFTGGSAAAAGAFASTVGATNGGAVNISGTTVSSNGNGAAGLVVGGTGSSITASGLAITATGDFDPAHGWSAGGARNYGFALYPDGGTLTLSNSTILTSGTQNYGVYTANGGTTTLNGDTITLQGANALAGVESGVGGATTINGGFVTTNGANSIAVYATGAGSTVTTTNLDATGPVTITTTGPNSNGVQADNGGAVALNGGSVTTSGNSALGLYASGTGSTITSTGTTIATGVPYGETTAGANAHGVQADSGGSVTLNGGSVTVAGTGSLGLFATGTGSQINATDVTVSTAGSGLANANAILADSGAVVTVNGGSASTTGTDAYVAGSINGATLNLNGTTVTATGDGSGGLAVNGTGSTITATGLTITTHGNYDSANNFGPTGATNQSYGEISGGGTLTLTNSSIVTTGTQAPGVYTANGGTTNLTGVSITTSNVESDAVLALSGAQVTVQGTTISTGGLGSGNGSKGFDIQGSGTVVTVNGVTVTTTGAINPATGDHSQALYNGDGTHTATSPTGGGVANVTNSTFVTKGVDSIGVDTLDGGTTTLSGGSVSTSGVMSAGVVSDSSASVSLTGVSVTTTGNGATGLGVNGGAELDALNTTVVTQGGVDPNSGDHAYGAYNGPSGSYTSGGVMKLTDTSISTQGAGMYGVITSTGGATTILGGSIGTAGTLAHAVVAENGGTITIGLSQSASPATAISTSGTHALGVLATNGGIAQLAGATITTSGDGSTGLAVEGASSSLTANGVTVTTKGGVDSTSGAHADGAYNGPPLNGSLPSGGVLSLTNSAIATSGADTNGIATSTGGVTTISGGSVMTTGLETQGVSVSNGGRVTMTGGSVTTFGDGSQAFEIAGAGSTLQATGVNVTTSGTIDASTGYYVVGLSLNDGGTASFTGGSITTRGASNTAVASKSASGLATSVTLSGTTILTTGPGASGLDVSGANASLAADGVSVTTQGDINPATGYAAIGAYNGHNPVLGIPVGGVLSLSNATIATSGVSATGVETNSGGVTNLSGVSVTTSGQDALALYVWGSGSQANLSGSNAFTTNGAGALGVVARSGGVINATGPISVTTSGGVSPATGYVAAGVVADSAGAKVNLAAATITTSGPGAFAMAAADSLSSGSAGAITATGALNIKTTNASDVGVYLQGNGASVLATGGGVITTAGNAISLTGGTGQIARFDSFTINNQSGNLIFADPSVATVNFNTTTANAGANNLLDATAGSMVTLNANASILTGVIKTDPTSTSNVNLTNGTTWTMTGSSTVTNLNVANSFVVFAPPGSGSGFKTLTVNTYVGSGANITMNATLGGSSSAADQIIVNGGSATGTTLLTIKNSGGLGGQTTGSGIPLVITTNGGTIAANAFTLANVPLVNGFRYTLDESNNAWYLVSTPASTTADITNSVTNVAKAQQNQMITNRVLNSILLGATQQISSCSCGGGFASVGSFAAGAQGRWGLSDALTLFGGFSYNQWNASGITVQNAPTIAGSLVYDFWKWGASRPFLEAGGSLTPYEDVHYSRSYADGLTTSVGNASAVDRDLSLFARAGWVARLSPVDEAAIYGDLSRNWMQTGGYTEMTSALNPFPATVSNGIDLLNVAHVGGQITHLFNGNIEANVSGAVAYGFGAGAGAAVNVYDFGPIAPNALPNTTWFEYGARIGYRFSDRLVVDAFVLGTAGGEIGSTVHGGVALRYAF